MQRPALVVAAFLFVLAFAKSATAQLPSVDTRTWRPSTDPNASLVIEPAITPGPGVASVSGYAHYSLQPIALRRAGTDDVVYRPLRHVVGFDPTVNIGIGQRLALGAVMPIVVYQTGDSNLPTTVASQSSVPSTAFGDLGLSVKGALVRNENGGFGLAGLGYVSLPTGDRASFASEGGVTASARLLAEYTLLVAVAQASLGYKVRTERQTWPAAEVGGYRFGDEIPWSAGFAVRPGIFGLDSANRQRLEVAAHGWLPAGPVGPFGSGDPGSAALSPVMLAVSDRIELGHYRDAFVTVGADIGLSSAVGVPAIRGIVAIGWAPRAHDMDHDGVKDDVDGCPEIPEDKDGFEDNDGCPEIDNDDDGILDKEDACPNVAGIPSDDRHKNGCPDKDSDGDGIGDTTDACPTVKGEPSSDPKKNGCPQKDSDGDGVDDTTDKCPTQPEDKDGFQDADGCPDPDNDNDGVADKDDACPNVAGEPSTDPARNGCPNDDRDGDTFGNDVDKCPDAAETFNGIADDDGCPDEGGKPLVTIDDKRVVRLAQPIKLTSGSQDAPDVDPASLPVVRALALELNRHPDWTLAVGARPAPQAAKPGTPVDPNAAQLDALARSFAIVRTLGSFTRRDGAAETVSWDAVKNRPQAETGIAFLVLVTPKPATTTAAPTAPTPEPAKKNP